MAEFIEYTTKEEDRLDLIAYRAYGSPKNWSGILAANPTLPIKFSYESGIRILIPVLDLQTISDNTPNLPPWKK